MSMLARGQAALIARMKLGAAPVGPVLYQRLSGGEAIVLTGQCWVGGRTPYKRTVLDGGPAILWSDRDYMIPAAELAVGRVRVDGVLVTVGTRFEPVRGDRITETIAGVARVFEVLAPAGEKEFRPAEGSEELLRVRTLEQGDE